MDKKDFTTIQISKTTRDRINKLRRGDETQDEFIQRLLDMTFPED